MSAEQLARKFHDAYERLAPNFGYETRKETREFDPTAANGRLMIATCAELSGEQRTVAGRTIAEWREFAKRDDCLDQMVPSDLRAILSAIL